MSSPLTLAQIEAAAKVIEPEATRTPALTSGAIDSLADATIILKNEAAQRAGSFKFRGAFHRVSAIPRSERGAGVVAVSSGNHGAAVACAAEILAMPATIFVPADVAPVKRSLIEGFGASIQTFPRSTPDREAPARALAAATGATFVHPFEDRQVMMGQGTTALELHHQVGRLDVLLVPMSGGGLMAGCGSALRELDPVCRMIGVEPAAGDDTRRSIAAGRRVMIEPPDTIADGLALTMPGETTFLLNRELVSEVITVSETAIVDAMRLAKEELDLRLEPSGAVGIAALFAANSTDSAHAGRWHGQRVGVVLSGGNIDTARFRELCG